MLTHYIALVSHARILTKGLVTLLQKYLSGWTIFDYTRIVAYSTANCSFYDRSMKFSTQLGWQVTNKIFAIGPSCGGCSSLFQNGIKFITSITIDDISQN